MGYLIFFIVLSLISVGCSIDRDISLITKKEKQTFEDCSKLSSENSLKITKDSEPGEKLKLCVTLVNKTTKEVLKNQTIHFYHTGQDGEYQPRIPDDESTARLSGTIFTNSNGKVFVETILPGDYGSSGNNRHIHTTIFGAKPIAYDIHFKQYTGFMGKNFIDSSDQHFLADLKRDENGDLITLLTIEAKFP